MAAVEIAATSAALKPPTSVVVSSETAVLLRPATCVAVKEAIPWTWDADMELICATERPFGCDRAATWEPERACRAAAVSAPIWVAERAASCVFAIPPTWAAIVRTQPLPAC